MIENTRLTIIRGGFYRCTPAWNRDRSVDDYYFNNEFAYLLPTSGGATIETGDGIFELKPGNIYFAAGHHMLRQVCEKEMQVYWIAFVSESFYLSHRLLKIRGMPHWPLDSMPWVLPVFESFAGYFEDVRIDGDKSLPREDASPGASMRVEALLLNLTAHLMEVAGDAFSWDDFENLTRLRPAIDFMDENFRRSPSLDEIAERVTMSAIYFHRLFKRNAGMTPFKYMENRRLDYARKLLFDQRLNIAEVAYQTGYHSPFYFSRAFRRRFGQTPSSLRPIG